MYTGNTIDELIKTADDAILRAELTRDRGDEKSSAVIAKELIRRTHPDTHPDAGKSKELFGLDMLGEPDMERDRR